MAGTRTRNYAQHVFFEAVKLLFARNCLISVSMLSSTFIRIYLAFYKDANYKINETFSLHGFYHGVDYQLLLQAEESLGVPNGEVPL